MNKLTKTEEEIMLILWELEEATVRDVIKKIDDPDVAYTTVASFIRILEKKEFVEHKSVGPTHPSLSSDHFSERIRKKISKWISKQVFRRFIHESGLILRN